MSAVVASSLRDAMDEIAAEPLWKIFEKSAAVALGGRGGKKLPEIPPHSTDFFHELSSTLSPCVLQIQAMSPR